MTAVLLVALGCTTASHEPKPPADYRGVAQYPLSGVSMRYSFDAEPNAPTRKKRQYFTTLGTRGIRADGWKAAALHAPLTGKGDFDKDVWELYHVDADRSESTNLAEKYPEKLQELIAIRFEEAGRNLVLPLGDRSAVELIGSKRPTAEPARERYVYRPGAAPIPESVAVNVRGRSYKILANVEITDGDCSGVILAHGSRFGGHSLFIKDRKLHYVHKFPGIKPEQTFVSEPLEPGKYTLGMEFAWEKLGEYGVSFGKVQYRDLEAEARRIMARN